MPRQISDDVWDRLNPSAGRLPPLVRVRLALAVFALAALVVAGVTVTETGAIVPRITANPGWGGWFEGGTSEWLVNRYHRSGAATTHVSHQFTIRNDSSYSLRIVGVDTDRPGMRVERADLGSSAATLTPRDAYLLRPGDEVAIRIYYDITDCAAVTALPQAIPIVVDRWFGRQRVPVTLAPLRPYRNGGWSVSPGDPKAVHWQRFLADHVCGVPYPDGL